MNRRFPPPWTVEEANNACFIVKDANGFAVSYVYSGTAHCRKQSQAAWRGERAEKATRKARRWADQSLSALNRAGAPNLFLKQKHAVKQRLGRRRAAWYVNIDWHNTIATTYH
jgi:hypothetical protein